MDQYRIDSGAKLPCGEMRRVDIDGIAICIVHVDDGKFFAIDDTCSHGQSSLSDGWLEGRELECGKHGALFDVATGAALTPPATIPVRAFGIAVDGDDLLVSMADVNGNQ